VRFPATTAANLTLIARPAEGVGFAAIIAANLTLIALPAEGAGFAAIIGLGAHPFGGEGGDSVGASP